VRVACSGPHHREPEQRGVYKNRQFGRQPDWRDTADGISGRRLHPVGVRTLALASAADTGGERLYVALPVTGDERNDGGFRIAGCEDQRLDDRARLNTKRGRCLLCATRGVVKRDNRVRMPGRFQTGGDVADRRMAQEAFAHGNASPLCRQA